MDKSAIIVTVIASLASGLIGSFVSLYALNWIENRKIKMSTLMRLLANRDNLTGADFNSAANEVIVVFRDNPKVLDALRNLHQTALTPGKPNINENLVVLLKEASKAAGLESKLISDTSFLNVFKRQNP